MLESACRRIPEDSPKVGEWSAFRKQKAFLLRFESFQTLAQFGPHLLQDASDRPV